MRQLLIAAGTLMRMQDRYGPKSAILLLMTALAVSPAPGQQIGPFVRPASGNPVITPQPASSFADPILGKPVHWEALHTFNPAAIVRGARVYLLYRAEDDSGRMAIGEHTSRLGLAVSEDGLHFTSEGAPVF